MALQHPPAPVPQQQARGLTDRDRRRIQDAIDRSVSANTRIIYRLSLALLRWVDEDNQ